MTDLELLAACKTGLNISQDTTALDGILTQKIATIKSYMKGAGVSDATINDDLAVGVIVMGVGDIWELSGGEVKLSATFHMFLAQLTYTSYASINAFSVTYDGNQNTAGAVPLDNNIYSQGESFITLNNIGGLARTGYVFSGWNSFADGAGKDYAVGSQSGIGVASKTLYAKWEAE